MKQLKGYIFTEDNVFRPGCITIENDLITDISFAEEKGQIPSQYLLPGLIDIHFHGCKGYDFCDGTREAYQAIAEYEQTHGITTICPATMTLPVERLQQICETAAEAEIVNLAGINLEGPFIAEEKKGAQKKEYIQKPNAALLEALQKSSGGMIKLVTIAPEVEGALECIKACRQMVKFSIGHTAADYKTGTAAMAAGAQHVTHLFNAMHPFSHRAPGIVGAALDCEAAEVELICDGIHIHPTMVRAAFSMFGGKRMILISDSMMATGMPDGTYALGGQEVNVKGRFATLKDGTLAGSVTNLYDCMVNAIQMGVNREDAIASATINPAKSIGIDKMYGSLSIGKKADILITDRKYKLQEVIKDGTLLHS